MTVTIFSTSADIAKWSPSLRLNVDTAQVTGAVRIDWLFGQLKCSAAQVSIAGFVPSHEGLGDKLVVVSFFEQLHDVVGIFALLQEAAKRFIAQLSRNVFQGSQVIAGAIGR